MMAGQGYLDSGVYYCFSNGMYLKSPYLYNTDEIYPLYEDMSMSEDCENIEVPVDNPEPFPGYDCRCRPWY